MDTSPPNAGPSGPTNDPNAIIRNQLAQTGEKVGADILRTGRKPGPFISIPGYNGVGLPPSATAQAIRRIGRV